MRTNRSIKLSSLLKKEQTTPADPISDLTQGHGSAIRLRVDNDTFFYVVQKASPDSTLGDIISRFDPLSFANNIRGGLKPEEIVLITTDRDKALSAAHDQIKAPGDDNIDQAQPSPLDKGKSKYYQNNRMFVREQSPYMGDSGDQVYIVKQGQGESAQYRLLNLKHDLIDMMFSDPSEAAKYAQKKGMKVVPKPAK